MPNPRKPRCASRREPVSEVVDRDDTPEPAPDWRRVGEAVQQIDTGPRRQSRDKLLFAAGPTRAGCELARGTVTAGINPPQEHSRSAAASRLMNAVKRACGAAAEVPG